MKEKDCNIIRDLLPSYIDGLTNEETNQYVEEHIKECNECKTVLENMKKMLETETTDKNSKEVKYFKKYNKKMKTLKITLLAILLIFVLSYVRKMVILVSLSNKVDEYTISTNYYMKSANYSGYDDSIITIESYVKDEKIINRFKLLSETNKINYTNYFNGKTVNSYAEIEFDEETEEQKSRKTAELNQEKELLAFIPDYIDMSHPVMFFGLPLFSSIESDKCDERDCYKITVNAFGDNYDTVYYIEKKTGLTIRILGHTTGTDSLKHDNITNLQYKFDVVTDEDFIEPDLSEYEIEE